MRTLCVQEPFFSDGSVQLHVPHSWDELTQEQLRYALGVLTVDWRHDSRIWAQMLMLMRFAGFSIERMTDKGWLCHAVSGCDKVFVLKADALTVFLEQLDWVYEDGACSVRLDECQGRKAVDAELHDVPFLDYLTLENYYQAYISQPEDTAQLAAMAEILYPAEVGDVDVVRFEQLELYGVFLWYRHVKALFSREFPNLFRPSTEGSADMKEVMNAQIRALTDGDITKEDAVCRKDVWRALTELDAKAKESQELKQKMKK